MVISGSLLACLKIKRAGSVVHATKDIDIVMLIILLVPVLFFIGSFLIRICKKGF